MYPEESTEEQPKISKYNAAVAQLYRIDNLWQQFQYYRSLGGMNNYLRANEKLDALYGELGADADSKEIKKLDNFKKLIIKYQKKIRLFYQVLLEKELWLRQLQNSQGKGTAYADPEEDALEE